MKGLNQSAFLHQSEEVEELRFDVKNGHTSEAVVAEEAADFITTCEAANAASCQALDCEEAEAGDCPVLNSGDVLEGYLVLTAQQIDIDVSPDVSTILHDPEVIGDQDVALECLLYLCQTREHDGSND